MASSAVSAAPVVTIERVVAGLFAPSVDVPELAAIGLLIRTGQPLPHREPAFWSGMAVALMRSSDGAQDAELRDLLLEACVELAASDIEQALPDLLDRLVGDWLSSTIHNLPRQPAQAVLDALHAWAGAKEREPRSWREMLYALAMRGDSRAVDILREELLKTPKQVGRSVGEADNRWILAAVTLMQVGDHTSWTPILQAFESNPELSAVTLYTYANLTLHGSWRLAPEDIASADLARLYSLMVAQGIGPDDDLDSADPFISPEKSLARIRQQLPHYLAGRTTPESLDALTALATTYPDDRTLAYLVRTATRRLTDLTWRPYTVQDLLKVASGSSARVVNDEYQLRDVVAESLERLQKLISAGNGWAAMLWNQEARKVQGNDGRWSTVTEWWPMWENDLSDFIATFLAYDLQERDLVINREVQLSRPGLNGGRLDIKVEAFARDALRDPKPLTVIIEAKGCWNSDMPTAMATQLVDRYLFKIPNSAGIYLVAYIDDSRRRVNDRMHARHTIREIREQQDKLAHQQLHDKGASVIAVVLDCRLPRVP